MGSQDLFPIPEEQPGHRDSPGPEQCAPPWGWRWKEAKTSVHRGRFIKRQTVSFAYNPQILNVCQIVTHLQVSVHPSSPTYPNAATSVPTKQSHPRSCRQEPSPAHPAEHLDSHICHILELLCCSAFP